MEELPDNQCANQAHDTRPEETVTPAQHTDDGGNNQKGQRFTNIVAGRPESIVGPPFLIREPTGKAYHTRCGSHRLKPAADPPKYSEQEERISKT